MEERNISFFDFRVFEKPAVISRVPLSCSQDIFNLYSHFSKSDREMFVCVFLNAKNHLIRDEIITLGTVDSSAVYPREVFRSALFYGAVSIICVHNHPSGDPEPSESDNQITRALVHGAHLLGLRILDHVVVGDGRYFSYADQGKIEDFEADIIRSL